MLPFRGVIYGRLKVFVVEDFSSPLTNSKININLININININPT